jgi:hypothetical protein
MTTYLIKAQITITRQEGDTADIVITVPALLSMTGYEAQFKVYNTAGQAVLSKASPATITVDGQIITIPLLAADTKGKPGTHKWELQIAKTGSVITIGKGQFVIVSELIK